MPSELAINVLKRIFGEDDMSYEFENYDKLNLTENKACKEINSINSDVYNSSESIRNKRLSLEDLSKTIRR
ncbi:hypothetical protein [Neofamilia massiliensis]|uniref:hypothetical protein n=1 Tax=Neofamilia massiliensis TaxID=1673724 RepID=UPI0006BB74D7|nr:hypothetical protein [Neofamilia massiliensis]